MSIFLVPVSVSVSVNTTVGGANPTIGTRSALPPPPGPNSFNFMQFLGKFGKIICLRLHGGFATPPPHPPGKSWIHHCPHFPKNPWKLRNIWSVWSRRFPWINHYETPITKIHRIVLKPHPFIFLEHILWFILCYKSLAVKGPLKFRDQYRNFEPIGLGYPQTIIQSVSYAIYRGFITNIRDTDARFTVCCSVAKACICKKVVTVYWDHWESWLFSKNKSSRTKTGKGHTCAISQHQRTNTTFITRIAKT